MSTTVIAAGSNFLVPNATFLVELVAFLILLSVLGRYIVPPLQRAVMERQELIRKQFEEAREAKERAEAAEAAYKASLERARAEGSQIREEARTQGREIIEAAQAKAQEDADRELVHGRQHLTTERDALARELRAGVGQLATDLAGRIVGESLADDARVGELVEEFQAEETTAAVAGESAL
ncbi:MAG: F0F1 ATP synthase subunit B [Mycobacteriales bacterium]